MKMQINQKSLGIPVLQEIKSLLMESRHGKWPKNWPKFNFNFNRLNN